VLLVLSLLSVLSPVALTSPIRQQVRYPKSLPPD